MAQTFKRSQDQKSDNENIKFTRFFKSLNKENQAFFSKADPAVKNLVGKKLLANFKHIKK